MDSEQDGKNYVWIAVDNAPKMPKYILHIAGEFGLKAHYDPQQDAVLLERNRKCTPKRVMEFMQAVFTTPEK